MNTENILLRNVQKKGAPLILNGAIGSVLQKYCINNTSRWTSELNYSNREVVSQLYTNYINSGADIIVTNTFRTNPAAVDRTCSIENKVLIREAFSIIRELTDENILIAASNAPAEDCYQINRQLLFKELELNHIEHIEMLLENNPDFILNETFGHLDEIKIVCEYCSKNQIPYVMSLFSFDGISILSGEKITEVISFIKNYNPLSISFNCWKPDVFYSYFVNNEPDFYFGLSLNCGKSHYNDNTFNEIITAEEYINLTNNFNSNLLLYIGSCCGSDYNHTKLLSNHYDKKN